MTKAESQIDLQLVYNALHRLQAEAAAEVGLPIEIVVHLLPGGTLDVTIWPHGVSGPGRRFASIDIAARNLGEKWVEAIARMKKGADDH